MLIWFRFPVIALGLFLVFTSSSLIAQSQNKNNSDNKKNLDKQERLKKRDYWNKEVDRFRQEGNWQQSLQAAEKMLAIEKELFGEGNDDVIGSMQQIAELQQKMEQWSDAEKTLQRIRQIQRQRFGEINWHLVDADWALKSNQIQKQLSKEQKKLLEEIERDQIKIITLYGQKRYTDAAKIAERSLKSARSIYGEQHPKFAQKLMNLATCSAKIDPKERALPLYLRSNELTRKLLGEGHPDYRIGLNNLAAYYGDIGQHQKALLEYTKVKDLTRTSLGENHPDFAKYLNKIAVCHFNLAQRDKALPIFLQVKDLRHKMYGENHPDYLSSLNNLAICYSQLDRHDEALPFYILSCNLTRKLYTENHGDFANSLNNLAECYNKLNQIEKALNYYQHAQKIYLKIWGENHIYYAISLNNEALAYFNLKQYDKALTLFQQARDRYRKTIGEKHPYSITCLKNIAAVYTKLNQHENALQLYQQANDLSLLVFGENHPEYLHGLNLLAKAYSNLGQFDKALPLNILCKELRFKVLGQNHPDYIISLNSLALCYLELSQFDKSLQLSFEAKKLGFKVLGQNHPDYVNTLNNLASCYSDLGQFHKALDFYLQARDLTLKHQGENHPDYALSLNNLAECYSKLDQKEQALKLHIQAHELIRKHQGENNPHYSLSLMNLAGCYSSLNQFNKALPLYIEGNNLIRKLLGENHPSYAGSLISLAFCYSNSNQKEKALPLYIQANDLIRKSLGENHVNYAQSLVSLAVIYSELGYSNKALPLHKQAVTIIQKKLNDTSLVLSEQEQLGYQQEAAFYLDHYFEAAIKSKAKPADIYEVALNIKGTIMARQRDLRLFRHQLAQSDPKTKKLITQVQELSAQISLLSRKSLLTQDQSNRNDKLKHLSQEREDLETQIVKSLPNWQRELKNISISELQKLLPDRSALLDFSVIYAQTNNSYVVGFYIPKTGPIQVKELGATRELTEAIATWRKSVSNRLEPIEFANDPARILRDRLLQPWMDDWNNIDTLLISADGVLGNISFPALPGKDSKKFLIEEKTVALIPVVKLLPDLLAAEIPKPNRSIQQLILYGGIDYGESKNEVVKQERTQKRSLPLAENILQINWPHLKGTRTEIEAIMAIFKETQNNQAHLLRTDKEANKSNFLKDITQTTVAHIATHGFFNRIRDIEKTQSLSVDREPIQFASAKTKFNPLLHPGVQSGLVFAGANVPSDSEDGILSALEIAELDLTNLKLAILSACETGLGKELTGEGTVGLLRAFQIAGAKNVIASSWEVGDQSTAATMKLFYINHYRDRKTPLKALRDAQLTIMYHPELIQELGNSRGIGLKILKIPSKNNEPPGGKKSFKATVGQWAGFSIAGVDK